MKWAVAQIRKFKKPYEFEYDFDLKSALNGNLDVRDVKKCHIKGILTEPMTDNFDVSLNFDLELVMQCAVSLEDVPVCLEFDSLVRFTYEEDESSDCYVIEKETVNVDEAVMSEIVINIPYRVVKEGYEDLFDTDEV